MRNHSLLSSIFLLLLLASCHSSKPVATSYTIVPTILYNPAVQEKAAAIKNITADAFEPFSFTGSNAAKLQCRLLKPASVKANKKYPLVIVFHGSDGVGNDNKTQVKLLAKLWASDNIRTKYPAYVLVPQFPQRSSNYIMNAEKGVLTSRPQAGITAALQLIDSLKNVLQVDESRIYVIGFSMGASTVNNAIAMRPDLFAAGIAFSGIPDLTKETAVMNTPLWVIHGNADTENVFASDSLFYKDMKAAGAKNIRFWEMDKMGHEVPAEVYTGEAIPKWLFSKKKNRM